MFLTKLGRRGLFPAIRRPVQLAEYSTDDHEKKNPSKTPKEKKPEDTAKEKSSASERLNKLLASMSTEDSLPLTKSAKVPQPAGGEARKKKRTERQPAGKDGDKPENIVEAAKKVADLIGDKTRQTEAELLSKLLNHVDGRAAERTSDSSGGQSLSDLIVGMKIDRTTKPPTRSEFVRKTLASRRSQQRDTTEQQEQERSWPRPRPRRTEPVPATESVKLFDERLGIFTEPDKLSDSPDILETWHQLYKRELKLAVTHPPTNYFEKMILWTEQGKIWKFPIDNEQGLDEEAKVDFTEHIFLEQHLEGWCPQRGPIRHFMELVCVGLSKNPYLKASEKREHILWYRDYFESKKELLKQVIVDQKETKTGESKSLES